MTSPTLREALEACPFCGKADKLESVTDGVTHWIVCRHCGCDGPVCQRECNRDAAWNRRATPSHEAGRRAGFEEAARVADDHARTWGLAHATPAIVIATAIRNLAGDEGMGE